uniref:Centriolin n=1 Tax=Podarcis muralis TaxID=64176 RepID=A0A670KLP4_PODMU
MLGSWTCHGGEPSGTHVGGKLQAAAFPLAIIHRNPGIRYITETLIKKLSKQENLARVTTLNLSLAKDGGKKFKYLENLEKCGKLEVLNLSNNLIEKIEKLDKLLKLRDLNLSFNKICKIEGIEHLQNLQKLNLAGNEIEHIPAWVGKKLRSLRILNLRKNKISSLHEITKLKSLKDLTSLFLADNPIVNLPHYRLYTIFHLRSLEDLEGQPVTNHDREEALERFNLEEIENLEKDLEKTVKELEDLKTKHSDLGEQLQQQDDLNKSLKQKNLQQKQSCHDLESELETKNELLKQKTVELTRACQKQYELEQELAFYKIDAKFEPLGYYPIEDVELDDVPGESPYIGKSRYKRNMYAVEGYIPSKAQKMQMGNLEEAEEQKIQKLKLNILQSLDAQLEEKERKVKGAQEKLTELLGEVANAEQRVLKATEELKLVQDVVAQKKMSDVEKDCLRQELSNKILLLNQLREEALELEKQMERQQEDMAKKEKELGELQHFIDSLDPEDPRHAHMKAQKASKEQQLDMMNKHYKHLESRLDDMLSRIAKETEEIRDLEQQLTDGQIAANDALKKDLEGIIIGLQEYLESVKSQAKQTSEECKELQRDKEVLLQRLEELEEERNQLEIVAMDAENLRKEIADLEQALEEQRELNEALHETQREHITYEAELEAELKARDIEANQHEEELQRLKQHGQLEHSALQAELSKERQALENALTKAQLSEEREQENNKLLSHLKQLQKDNNLLKQQLKDTQNQLNHAVDSLIHPEEFLARVRELKENLQTGAEFRCHNAKDILGKSLADLQKEFGKVLAQSQQENEAIQARERQLQKEMTSQQAKLEEAQEKYRLACNKAAEAKIKSEKMQNEARVHQLENEIQHLSEKLKNMEEIQGLTDQQLQEADEEKERILAQLEYLENRKKVEDAKAQMQFIDIDKELQKLKRAISTSDKQAAADLCAAKDQLRSLRGTVCKINQERSEELQEAEKFCMLATQASKDLARAESEIELLQKLLKEKEEWFQSEVGKADAETAASAFQKEEIGKLKQLLKCQKTEIDRLHHVLDQVQTGNREEIDSILDEIAALRHAISHQNDAITSIMNPLQRRGHLYYVPSSQTSTPASQSTKDSGVGLQCPMLTPIKKGQSKKECSMCPAARGCLVHAPGRSDPSNGGKSVGLSSHVWQFASSFVPPPGSIIYTLLPDGAPAPPATVVCGPPSPVSANGGPLAATTVIYGSCPAGAQLVYSPLPANCSMSFGTHHCNIPEHHNLENEISRLKDSIENLKSQPKSSCPRSSHREHDQEMDELHQGIQDLLNEREELEYQVAELRRIAQKRNKDFIDGHLSGLISELELEKSLQHHENIVDEIECIGKTLLKRQAELREADRLLAEAETELENTRGKTKETIQKYNSAKQHLSRMEKEAEELERRAQVMALKLVNADQQLRLLQADAKDLEEHKIEQEGILKEINKVISAKDSEFQSLSQKIEILTESLQKLQADIQVAEGNEDHHLQILKEAENILRSKKSDLVRLKDQVTQQQERLILDRLLGQKNKELLLLQESIAQKNAALTEALGHGEAEVAEKRRQIKEVKSFLEDLSVQKGELNAQLSEKRSQLSLVTQDIQKEEEKLQDVLGQIMKHKTELRHVLEMLYLKNDELEGLKLQQSQKVNELEKMQVAVLEKKLELETLQQASQQQCREVERQRQLLERAQQDTERLSSKLHSLQNSIKALSTEKQKLEENCERHQLSEKELKLQEKNGEVLSLQRELELSKAKETVLHDQIQTEREKAEKQIEGLKEAIKMQKAQLERALHEQKQENHCLQKEVASIEQVAQDNHLRAKQLMRDLSQIQVEYMQLKSQVGLGSNKLPLFDMKGTVKSLKLEVKDKMRTGLKDLSQSPPKLLGELETTFEIERRPQSDLESLKENYPFTNNEGRMLCFDEKLDLSKVHITDEQWRGKARREQLQHHEDRLKAQLRQCMSKQVEVLIKGKQQTEGTLHSLKRQVDALDELVSSTSTDSQFPSLNSSGLTDSLHEESILTMNQVSFHIDLDLLLLCRREPFYFHSF